MPHDHTSKVTRIVSDFFESEEGFSSLDELADDYLQLLMNDLKRQVEKSAFVKNQHADSAKMKIMNEILHGLTPKLIEVMHKRSMDELHMDVIIAQSVEDSE